MGSKGDSYDNALAEALNSLHKAELIRNQGPWQDIDAARAHHHRAGPLVRAPPGHTPPSACEPPPSTKPPGHSTPTGGLPLLFGHADSGLWAGESEMI